MQNFKWYTVVNYNEQLEQGDFLNRFPMPIPIFNAEKINLENDAETEGDLLILDVIIMTQSCDLVSLPPDGQVILCQRQDIKDAKMNNNSLNTNGKWKELRKGLIIGSSLLSENRRNGYKFGYQVVNLQQIYTAPLSYIKAFIESKQEKRVRLLSPYREHLAQVFASQFMRVGLPIPLPENNPNITTHNN